MKLYPWEKWLAQRKPFRLKKGRDFDCAMHSMSMQVRQRAAEHGLKASVLIQDEVLVVELRKGSNGQSRSGRKVRHRERTHKAVH